MFPIRKPVRLIERFVVYRILHADDTPHRLALGVALGIFVAWTPTIGLQMILVILLAPLIRANGRVGVPLVWISNPLTFALIYYPNYLIGRYLMGMFVERPSLSYSYQQIQERLSNTQNIGYMLSHFHEAEFWHKITKLVMDIGVMDLLIGSVIVGLVLGLIVYVVSYKVIVWYRLHNPMHRRRWRKKSDDVS